MKEAFELIKERLEEESHYSCFHCMERAISIVSEVEAEYGNGWIPVEERLPEEPSVYLVCYKNPNCFPSVQLFSGGRFLNYYLEEDKHVIAWMPLPSPYKPTTD